MSSDPSTPAPYRFVTSEANHAQLRELSRFAASRGLLSRYRAVLLALTTALTDTPNEWGDPQYELPQLGLMVYHRLNEDFSISYAVDERRHIVYLRFVRWVEPPPKQPSNGQP